MAEHLHADHTAPRARHGEKAVGNIHALPAAIVGPQAGNAAFQKRIDVDWWPDRPVQDPAPIKFKVGQGVYDRVATEEALRNLVRPPVAFQMLHFRFVGDVEKHLLAQAPAPPDSPSGQPKLPQELHIFGTQGVRFPAEQPGQRSVLKANHHLGSVLGPHWVKRWEISK